MRVDYPISVEGRELLTVTTDEALSRDFRAPFYRIEVGIHPVDEMGPRDFPVGRSFIGRVYVPASHGALALTQTVERFLRQLLGRMCGADWRDEIDDQHREKVERLEGQVRHLREQHQKALDYFDGELPWTGGAR